MSKFRKGAAYLRRMKPTDKADSLFLAVRLAFFSDPRNWKHPERCRPVVLVQHGCPGVVGVWMNREEALRALWTRVPNRRRNIKHNPRRGLRITRGELNKALSGWAFGKNKRESA